MKESLFSDVLDTFVRSVAEEEVMREQHQNKEEFEKAAKLSAEDIFQGVVVGMCQEVAQENMKKHAALVRSKKCFQKASIQIKDEIIGQTVNSMISEIANHELNLQYDNNKQQFEKAAEQYSAELIADLINQDTLALAQQQVSIARDHQKNKDNFK